MKASTILVLETNVGTSFPIDANSIECFGVFGGVTFVRTKTGLQHLIKGDVENHCRAWRAALDGYEIIDVEIITPTADSRQPTADHQLTNKPHLLTEYRKPKTEE